MFRRSKDSSRDLSQGTRVMFLGRLGCGCVNGGGGVVVVDVIVGCGVFRVCCGVCCCGSDGEVAAFWVCKVVCCDKDAWFGRAQGAVDCLTAADFLNQVVIEVCMVSQRETAFEEDAFSRAVGV